MERRDTERKASSLPVVVSTDEGTWKGTCINYSTEGALLKLETPWAGAPELTFRLDPDLTVPSAAARARVVRSSSPDQVGSFLAIRFLEAPGLPQL